MNDAPANVGEFQALPTIESQFPLVFETGGRWTTMTGTCMRCEKDLSGELLRGHVTCPFGKTFLMEAWGLCPCGFITSFRYRFPPDMSVVGRSPRDGEWSIWEAPRRASWWRSFLWLA
jgi:hypothetical protein